MMRLKLKIWTLMQKQEFSTTLVHVVTSSKSHSNKSNKETILLNAPVAHLQSGLFMIKAATKNTNKYKKKCLLHDRIFYLYSLIFYFTFQYKIDLINLY